jgi:DNA-directed RNA polymerase I, II, and III subunit RPABC2
MNRLTKYEKARILGNRATQLSEGAPPMVNIEGLTDHMEIAKKELMEGKLPFIIRRYYPNDEHKDIKVTESIFEN